MNEKNYEYLKDQIKFTGFGSDLSAQLKENMQASKDSFTLKHQATYGKDKVDSELQFKKSAQTDRYFFNGYDSSLKKPENDNSVKQHFPINRDGNITRKEAYNLLDGRAVNKELVNKDGKLYNAWLQLDFKQSTPNGNHKLQRYSDQYGYDLEKNVSKIPVKELDNTETKSNLLDSLKKGNRQPATLVEQGTEQKVYLEANPKFKSVTVYDQNHERIRQQPTVQQTEQQKQQSEIKTQTQSEKKAQTQKSEEQKEPAAKKRRGKKI
jgi:hypothetical protein